MLKLAVIGKDVSRSLSPAMHGFILGQWGAAHTYDAVSIPPAAFAARAEQLFHAYDGFNVTIPFKAEIIPFLRECAGDAAVFGAVNTVLTAARRGFNTDGLGFMLMLENAGIDVGGGRALVLGAGGAGRSCIYKLAEAGADVSFYERSGERLAAVAAECRGAKPLSLVAPERFDLIVNCTGIGMHESVGRTPSVRTREGEIPVGAWLLEHCAAAVDLIYEPARSEFLRIAEGLGCRTVNGEAMLFYQAYYADCIYLGRTPSAREAKQFYQTYSGGKQ